MLLTFFNQPASNSGGSGSSSGSTGTSTGAIPANLRTPGAFVELDNSKALPGVSLFNTKILVLGGCLTTGTIPAGQITICNSPEQAKLFWGKGSMLANMFQALKDNGQYIQAYGIGLADATGSTAATGTITVTGTAGQNGTIFLYVAGKLIRVPVVSSDSANTVALSIQQAIGSNVDLPISAIVSANVVTITAKQKGTIGNTLDVRLNYYGAGFGEFLPAGLTVAIVPMSGGATDPSVSNAIAAMPDIRYDFIVTAYTDPTNLNSLENELSDRWGPMRLLEGQAFAAYSGSLATLGTFGNSRNSRFVSTIGVYNSPSPTYEWAAAMASKVGEQASTDPAAPSNGLELVGILPPLGIDLFSNLEKNALLYEGISTYRVSEAGKVHLERVITMYQVNPLGAKDPSYLDITTMSTLAYLSLDVRNFLQNRFDGYKIADDDTRFDAGQKITTPKAIKAELVGHALEWEKRGLVEDISQFETDLVVARNTADPTRVDVQLPPNLVNPLYIIALQLQFIL